MPNEESDGGWRMTREFCRQRRCQSFIFYIILSQLTPFHKDIMHIGGGLDCVLYKISVISAVTCKV
jgi:hypothetical protein